MREWKLEGREGERGKKREKEKEGGREREKEREIQRGLSHIPEEAQKA